MVPFVKWIGGKRKLLPEILKRIPKKYNKYFEPFLGGGALFFALKPHQAFVNDINKSLIITYKVIKRNHKLLVEILKLLEMYHNDAQIYNNSEIFNKLRNLNQINKKSPFFNLSNEFIAAQFIYLNKACFNGLYRVNKNGVFNVPNGKRKKLNIFNYQNIVNISNFLKNKNIKIFNQSFEKICKKAEKDDFLYLDPPYDYEIGKKGFDAFYKKNFGTRGQKLLAKVCQDLDSKGAKFMVSNHNTKLIRELYQDFKIEIIEVKRLVGGKYAARQHVEEVIIRNYE